ncbi:hypothetical protein, partial [Serratia marcescens]|uniref:hypothetical protein n=1 Tax=Serratia marcescens TaxID=615 RepID=UPI001CA3269F
LLFKFKHRKIKMYQQQYKNRIIDDNEYSSVLQWRMKNLLEKYNVECKNLNAIGITNLGFGHWESGESKINVHIRAVNDIHEKMQSTQAMIDMLCAEEYQRC